MKEVIHLRIFPSMSTSSICVAKTESHYTLTKSGKYSLTSFMLALCFTTGNITTEFTNVLSLKNCFKKHRKKCKKEANISKNPIVFRFWDWQDVANAVRRLRLNNTLSFIEPPIARLLTFTIAAPKNLVLVLKFP
ncbi:hypothetical protein COT49_02450 [candidate division WWE3 bacterium CG08_land_8_20_14_0_20_40_13]|uniref:Uncharacterized protein n=1 Tax=candidate division WWE3 bacterium CG08_land_8_20_14_0_20_40_13 TaxID=1975084 RepID=A0A2H0XDS4_UNCKA|nr:MAG: hypothetical protein COT49_02450 [candidate division WWE3 bacterium CG08_land_8_20_14_0_20_40_13]